MSVKFEYPNKFTFSKIKTKTESVRPIVEGIQNYLFRLKSPFVGINIKPDTGVIMIGTKAVPGNYVLEIDCVDSVSNKIFSTKHVVFVRDPNEKFPGDDDITEECEFKSEVSKKGKSHDKKIKSNKNHSSNNINYKLYKYFNNSLDNNKNVWLVSIIFTILITLLKLVS